MEEQKIEQARTQAAYKETGLAAKAVDATRNHRRDSPDPS